jgi:hypothetical protein
MLRRAGFSSSPLSTALRRPRWLEEASLELEDPEAVDLEGVYAEALERADAEGLEADAASGGL